MNKGKTKLFLFGIITLVMLFPQIAFGIGQVTKPVLIEEALRGQEFIELFSFSNAGEKDVVYNIVVEGDIIGWVEFFELSDTAYENPVASVTVPSGPYYKLNAKFTIPEDAANGEYTGKVFITYTPEAEEMVDADIGFNVGQRIGRNVTIAVTDQEVIDFDTSIIPINSQVESDRPAEFKIIYNNMGNIAIKPGIQMKISRDDKSIHNVVFPYPEDEAAVKPGENKIMPKHLEWDGRGQEDGNYVAEFSVLLNNEIQEIQKYGIFVGDLENAREEYSGRQKEEREENKMTNLLFDPVSIAIIIIAGAMITFFYKRKKEAKPDQLNLKKKK